MKNEVYTFIFLYQLVVFSLVTVFSFLMAMSFLSFWYVHGDRREKKLSKRFAFFPTFSNKEMIWLKFYICYQEFSPGVCLGGTIRPTYSGRKDRNVSWNGSGSFFPSYHTIYKGGSIFGIRPYLRKEGFKGEIRKQREKAHNFANLEKFFGKEQVAKWKKRAE